MIASDGGWKALCSVLVRAAAEPGLAFDREASAIFERAEVDWQKLASYVAGAGLARPLMGALNDPVLTRSVPASVIERLSERGTFDVVRERAQKEAIARIADALGRLRARGVLLKGSAFLMRAAPFEVTRATSDVDILAAPEVATELRRHLLDHGFRGDADAKPETFHHLCPIAYRNVAIEIHTRVMPEFWGLPEDDMLANVRHVPGFEVLGTLDPRGLVLHSFVHVSASFYSFGLKTAWDLLAVLRREPEFDWSSLLDLVLKTRAPRAFWAPMRALTEGLGLPVPPTFLRHAPDGAGTRRAEDIARHRILTATEGLLDLDILTKTGLTLLLLDNWSSRARYVEANLRLLGGRPDRWGAALLRARRADVVHQGWRHYSRYRRR